MDRMDNMKPPRKVNVERGNYFENVKGDVHIGDKVYSRSQAEELHDYLSRAVSAFEARMYPLVARPVTSPDQPYKFLYAFKIEDAGIFSGRDAASKEFHEIVLKDRLAILHARSGIGKTSLLNAGLSPRLIREHRLPVYARVYEDPILAIKRAIVPPSLGQWPELLSQLTLQEFLGVTCEHLSHQTEELVIILDQFEEFFIFWPEQDHRQPFIDALASCYNDNTLKQVRFIISLRKDYHSDLADFEDRIHTIFHNHYRLNTMTRKEAQEAITCPVTKLNRTVNYEQGLLDTLLDDLTRGEIEREIELPHLQIICTQLYDMLAKDETNITLAAYEKLDRAEGVLGRYLNSVLGRLPGRGEAIAKEVLKELVSSEETRRRVNYDTLIARIEKKIEVKKEELDTILVRLVDARLLSRDKDANEINYEMAHEYLIEEIKKWMKLADLELKRAEELLVREVKNWRVNRTPIPEERLKLLHAQRYHLGWDDEKLRCILLSALQADYAIEDWAELAGERGEKLLLEALQDPNEEVRHAATRGLGTLWRSDHVVRLGDKDSDVRREAAEELGKSGNYRAVEPLVAALQDEESSWAAAMALGQLGDPRAVEPLIMALQNEKSGVRLVAARALGQLGDPRAVEPLITTLQKGYNRLRSAAAEALKEIGTPKALAALMKNG